MARDVQALLAAAPRASSTRRRREGFSLGKVGDAFEKAGGAVASVGKDAGGAVASVGKDAGKGVVGIGKGVVGIGKGVGGFVKNSALATWTFLKKLGRWLWAVLVAVVLCCCLCLYRAALG